MKLKVADQAPDFKLSSRLEKDVHLSNLRDKTIVLAFYPQAWTPV